MNGGNDEALDEVIKKRETGDKLSISETEEGPPQISHKFDRHEGPIGENYSKLSHLGEVDECTARQESPEPVQRDAGNMSEGGVCVPLPASSVLPVACCP